MHKTIASPAHIGELADAVETTLAKAGIDRARIDDARLIVEELACNALAHGGATGSDPLQLRLRLEPAEVVLELADGGPAFDPTAAPAPDLDAHIDQRPVGGLGLHLVRELAHTFDYRRHEGRNLVRVTLRLDPATG